MRPLIYKAHANTITVFVNLNISSRYYDALFVKCLLKHNTGVVVLALEIFDDDIMKTFNRHGCSVPLCFTAIYKRTKHL